MRKYNDDHPEVYPKLVVPSNQKLYNLITRIKLELFGEVNIGLAVLTKWLVEHSNVPEDEDEPFVVDYVAEANVIYHPIELYDEDEDVHEQNQVETEEPVPEFPVVYRYFISTKRLLSNAKKSDHICGDATYKLTVIGAPCLINGTTDKKKQFHPFGIAITSAEKAADFEFVFNAVKKGVLKLEQYTYKPKALIADAAGAITNGFMHAFGYDSEDEFTRIYCWAHVNINLDKKVKIVKNTSFRTELMRDICSI